MKVLLAYPSFIDPAFADPPLGIVLLGTILEKHGVDVELIATSRGENWDSVKKKIESSKPDVLGGSILTASADAGFKMAEIAKEILPSVFVIMGGPHATVLPYETLENKHVDAVCLGEGEKTLIELIEKFDKLEGIEGIYYKKHGEIKMNPPRSPIEDLDSIPFPKWSLLPSLEDHFRSGNTRQLPIFGSRGCPFNCRFCQPTLRKMFGRKMRFRSSENVVDEIEYLVHTYSINRLSFSDDTFTINKGRLIDICQEIIKRGIRVSFCINSRVDTVTEEMLVWLKRAGPTSIAFGVESGSEYIRNSILGKGISTESIKRAFELCHKMGIKTNAFIMLGSPGETRQSIEETLELVRQIKPDYISPAVTTPLPGTFLWDMVKQSGTLNVAAYSNGYYIRDFRTVPIKLEHVTEEDIRKTGEALIAQDAIRHIKDYLLYAFRHPLRALRRANELHLFKNFINLIKKGKAKL